MTCKAQDCLQGYSSFLPSAGSGRLLEAACQCLAGMHRQGQWMTSECSTSVSNRWAHSRADGASATSD